MLSIEPILLQEYVLNPQIRLQNRIVMAPMTRAKTAEDGLPIPAMVDY